MKLNKHIHDEDYDFSIKLMVPLLTIFVCTICLCATTWAWYTASVSTGVTGITAKANVTENLICNGGCSVDGENGEYILEQNVSYTLTFEPGDAQNGYIALIDLEDYTDTSQTNTASVIDLFVNRVYADEPEAKTQAVNSTKGYVLVNKSDEADLEIPITVSSKKTLKIQYIWYVVENNEIVWGEYQDYGTIQFTNASGISLQEPKQESRATITFNFINKATGDPLPYSALGIENYGQGENEEELPETATIVYEATGEEIKIFAPDGYLLEKNDSFNETKNVESRIYRINTSEDVVITVYCIEISQEITEDSAVDNTTESDATITDTTTPPAIENGSDETETSDATDQNSSSEIPNAEEINQSDTNAESSSDKPIESLLITDSNGEGTTETTPSSDESNSETGDVSE